MSTKKSLLKVVVVAFMIVGILCLHYFTLPHMRYQHAVYRMLFYLPLVLASLWFGLKGALYVSGSVSVLYLPHLIKQWQGLSLENFHKLTEGALYIVIAVILGLLVEKERKKHRALLRAESLAAVGKAVSEIAHDMKTPLMAIGGFTARVAKKLGSEDPSRKKLEIVIQQTARLDAMVKEMLAFGKPLELDATKTNINDLIEESLAVAQPTAREAGVELEADLEPSLPALSVDVAKIKQVILNLITNAVQASPAGKKVLVKTHRSGNGIRLEVVDCGCGIREEDRERVFEPFFSTKGEGTGLGLGIVKKIVEAHGGEVFFDPNAEKGVTFKVRLPVVRK